MRSEGSRADEGDEGVKQQVKGLPKPTTSFRRRAWLEFQRAIDPLAPPKPFKIGRR
jgi:hypothetical protein